MPQPVERKLPIHTRAVNGLLVCALMLSACGPMVSQPSYPQRPDSVRPGAPFGPFTGRVVDDDTGQPLEGAVVWASWAFQRGVGNSGPEASRTLHTRTDADGRYRLPALAWFPQGLSTRTADFTLLIHKPGYVAYRNDRIFAQSRRPAFSQLGNNVRLSRWSPELSHAEHLLFLGSGAPLRKAREAHIIAAVAQLEGSRSRTLVSRAPTAPQPVPPRKRRLLSIDDVRAVTGFTGLFQEGQLTDPGDADDTYHLRAVDRPERYDVALRIWRLEDPKLTEKYEQILGKLPGSKQTDEIADRSFVATQGEILGLGFMDRTDSVMVLLTCGKGQCHQQDHLQKLAKRVLEHLRGSAEDEQ